MLFSCSYAFQLCSLVLQEQHSVQLNGEYTEWSQKHGSLQQLQMLQRICYSESSKRWTTGGMYAELEMVLTVKHSASNNNSTWCKKTVSVENYTVSSSTVIYLFSFHLNALQIEAFFWKTLYLIQVWQVACIANNTLNYRKRITFAKFTVQMNHTETIVIWDSDIYCETASVWLCQVLPDI